MTQEQINSIADFFIKVLSKDKSFNSIGPVSNPGLLYPPFFSLLMKSFSQFSKQYDKVTVQFTETYRSNALQEHYFSNGASKIKVNGMHHYGIAADLIFNVNGIRTYKGDITKLRTIFVQNGLIVLGLWDAFHVQYIPISQQQQLRNTVTSLLTQTT